MNNWISLPGFPSPEKQDVVRFYVLKKLSYSARMLLYLLFVGIGFIIQLITLTAWPGAVFLICATALNLVRGYDSRVRLKTLDIDSNWTDVDMERIKEIETLEDRITKWNRDTLDISNGLGVGIFIAVFIGLFVLSQVFTIFTDDIRVGAIFMTNAVILVLPIWFNGIRRILKQNNLQIKIGIIKEMNDYFQSMKLDNEEFKPAIMLARDKTGKSVPTDARFTISVADMPDGFYGIQAQINLNIVEGASYPYFYCVIPAQAGYGLEKLVNGIKKKVASPEKIVVEFQKDRKAEVIVIRQHTTNTSGYRTDMNRCREILMATLNAARIILKN